MLTANTITLSPKGQLTLPAHMRKALGLSAGSPVSLRLEGGEVVLSAAVVLPVEMYDASRESEFAEAAALSPAELAAARLHWGV